MSLVWPNAPATRALHFVAWARARWFDQPIELQAASAGARSFAGRSFTIPARRPHESVQLVLPAYRSDIDGLRALAVLSVIGFHAFPASIRGGFIGVDIFFVISGYLISTILFQSLSHATFSFTAFYARRVRRLLPALIAVLIFCIAFGWFWLIPGELKELGKHVLAGAGFVSNFVLSNETGYFDGPADLKPLLHLWSLGIEEQFYIVWPLVLWLAWKSRQSWLGTTVLILCLSLSLNLVPRTSDGAAAFFSPHTRFWELLVGSALAHMELYGVRALTELRTRLARVVRTGPFYFLSRDQSVRNAQATSGALLLGLAYVIITQENHFPGAWALLPTIGVALIISAGRDSWINRTILSNRFLVWIGLISYPLYLWHWPLLAFARILENGAPNEITRFAMIGSALVLAALTYELIERPVRSSNSWKLTTALLVIALGLTAGVGSIFYQNDGLPSRYPLIGNILHPYSYDEEYRHHTCFLAPNEDYVKFQDCGRTRDRSRTTVLIWGDSHAAHLFPGYEHRVGKASNLILRTASACPRSSVGTIRSAGSVSTKIRSML